MYVYVYVYICTACDLKHGLSFKKRQQLSARARDLYFFFVWKVYVCIVDYRSFISYCEQFCQGETFHLAILSHNNKNSFFFKYGLAKYNSFNTNKDIDLKIRRDMHWSLAHIFIIVNFSWKCLFLGAIFSFPRQGMSGTTRWWTTWEPLAGPYKLPLEVQRGYVGHSLSQICLPLLLNCIWFISWFFISLGTHLIHYEARFWVARCIYGKRHLPLFAANEKRKQQPSVSFSNQRLLF